MATNKKKEKPCKPLEQHTLERLARYIITQTERDVRSGTGRKTRIAAPPGAVIIF